MAFLSFIAGVFLKGFNAKAGFIFSTFAFGMYAWLAISSNDLGKNIAKLDGTYFEVPLISQSQETSLMWINFLFMVMSLMFIFVNAFSIAAEVYKPAWKKNPIIQDIWGK